MEVKKIPAVSIFHFFANANQILHNPLSFHRKNFDKLGDTFRVNLSLGNSIILSRDAGFARYVLQKNHKNYQKSPIQTKDLAKYVGKGLLTAEGEHWRTQRRLIQPAFHKDRLMALLNSIHAAILTELDKIEVGNPADVFPVFNDLAFQTVVKSLFSSAVSGKDINRLQFITEAAQKMLVKELRQFYKKWWFRLNGSIKHHTGLTGEARRILKRIVDERKRNQEKEDDLLNMLLETRYDDGSHMEEDQLLDEILILFTAGHETTSNALTFTCELLARHPNIQEQLAEEVIIAKKETNSLFEFMQRSTLAKQVIEESMRLYPPAYFIDRINIEEDYYNGMRIPKGSSVLFSMYEIHRHRELWKDPEMFIPHRFSEGKNLNYYPFGAGPRKCIGNNFAMYEMIITIAEVMFRYRISLKTTPIEVKPLITLKPHQAILQFNAR